MDRALHWVRGGPQTRSARRRRSGAGAVEPYSPPLPHTHSKMRGKLINPIIQQFLIRKVREMIILSPYPLSCIYNEMNIYLTLTNRPGKQYHLRTSSCIWDHKTRTQTLVNNNSFLWVIYSPQVSGESFPQRRGLGGRSENSALIYHPDFPNPLTLQTQAPDTRNCSLLFIQLRSSRELRR